MHGRQIPHIAHYRPAGHHHVQILQHRVPVGVPEGVSEPVKKSFIIHTRNIVLKYLPRIVFNRNRINHAAHLKAALLELHH